MLCFSILLFIGNSVSAIDQDHSPPGIEMKYDMPEGVSIEIFTIKSFKSISVEPVIVLSPIFKYKIKRGGLYAVRLWWQDSGLIINNVPITNSLYAFNHLLYETRSSKNCNQWTRSVNKRGVPGIETAYEQVSRLSL